METVGGILWTYLVNGLKNFGTNWEHLGDILWIFWENPGEIFWTYFDILGTSLRISRAYLGDILRISLGHRGDKRGYKWYLLSVIFFDLFGTSMRNLCPQFFFYLFVLPLIISKSNIAEKFSKLEFHLCYCCPRCLGHKVAKSVFYIHFSNRSQDKPYTPH